MNKRGPDKFLGKRQYEIHIKHLAESSDKAKLYVELSETYLLPEYNCHAMDEKYLKKYKNNEVIRVRNDEYMEFLVFLLK